MKRMGVLAILGCTAVALALGSAWAGATTTVVINHENARFVPPSDGQAMYTQYCASCHGVDGRGYGPANTALNDRPLDLTRMTSKNDGVFPRHHVRYVLLDAGPNSAHGTDMPAWSSILAELNRDNPGTHMLRVRNISSYLESIQEPPMMARK